MSCEITRPIPEILPGDTVRCVGIDSENLLTVGELYTVDAVSRDGMLIVINGTGGYVRDPDGSPYWFCRERFEKVGPTAHPKPAPHPKPEPAKPESVEMICIDNSDRQDQLTVGKRYKVTPHRASSHLFDVERFDDGEYHCGAFTSRFRPVSDILTDEKAKTLRPGAKLLCVDNAHMTHRLTFSKVYTFTHYDGFLHVKEASSNIPGFVENRFLLLEDGPTPEPTPEPTPPATPQPIPYEAWKLGGKVRVKPGKPDIHGGHSFKPGDEFILTKKLPSPYSDEPSVQLHGYPEDYVFAWRFEYIADPVLLKPADAANLRPGAKLLRVDDELGEGALTVGKVYEFEKASKIAIRIVSDDTGFASTWSKPRFVLLEDGPTPPAPTPTPATSKAQTVDDMKRLLTRCLESVTLNAKAIAAIIDRLDEIKDFETNGTLNTTNPRSGA